MAETGNDLPASAGGLGITLKDSVIAIPLVASTLAITWEVGYFWRIRGSAFGLFSIAEHITFSLQALPFAFMLSTMMVFVSSSRFQQLKLRLAGKLLVPHIVLITGGVAAVLLASLLLTNDWIALFIASLWTLPYYYVAVVPRSWLVRPMTIYGGFICIIVSAFVLGYFNARSQIISTSGLNKITLGEKGKESEATLAVRILRTGERGILYFNPQDRTFGLLSWDYVKRVDWPLTPLFTWHPGLQSK